MNQKQTEERKIIIGCIYGEHVLGNEVLAKKYEEMLKDYNITLRSAV